MLTELPPPASPGRLTRLQKAAVIYRMLGSLGMSLPDGALSAEDEAQLNAAMAGLGGIDPAELAAVIDEFLMALAPPAPTTPAAQAPALPGLPGLPGLPDLPMIGPLDAAMPDPGPLPAADDDPWDRVTGQEDPVLLALLEAEAPEVGAVILSKLKVSRAAELLGRTPGPLARRITYAVSQISEIRPDTVARIGRALAAELGRERPRAFTGGPVERVGAILNFSRAATRNDVLDGLTETDPEFAEAVRKSIFTYLNIPARVGPRDVPKLLKKVDQKVLVTALAASTADDTRPTAEFILANISQRMAEALRTEAAEMGEVAVADGETAMNGVVAAIRELEEAGEIYLVAEEE
jgi:flagellar motor switch protein FliG